LYRVTYGKDKTNGYGNGHDHETGEVMLADANPSWKKKWGRFQSHTRGGGKDRNNFDKSGIICYNCGRNGHISNECRVPKTGNVFSPKTKEATAAQVRGKKGKKKDGIEIIQTIVQSALFYGSETWIVTPQMLSILDGFHLKIARRIAKRMPQPNQMTLGYIHL
jgi:Zinc knuckle